MISELNGTDISFSDRGVGPTLLALHGALSSAVMWEPLFDAMPGVRFVAPDLPGHGKSAEALPDMHTQSTNAMIALVKATNAPVDLVGHSLGGTIALRIAIEAPELVRSLTLIEPVFFAAAFGHYRKKYIEHSEPQIAAMELGNWEEAARLFMADWGDGMSWDQIPAAHRRYIADRMPIVSATAPALMDDAHRLLGTGRLERADMPILLVEGTQTMPIITHILNGLAERLPNARRVMIPGAGHMLPASHADGLSYEMSRIMAVA